MKKLNNNNKITPFIQQQLQRIRKEHKLSEEAAATKADLSLKEYIAIEQGSKRISIEILAQLGVLGVKPRIFRSSFAQNQLFSTL